MSHGYASHQAHWGTLRAPYGRTYAWIAHDSRRTRKELPRLDLLLPIRLTNNTRELYLYGPDCSPSLEENGGPRPPE